MTMMSGGFLIWVVVLLLFLLLVGAVVAVVIWAVVQGRRGPGYVADRPQAGDALDILRRRYARGEITREEFERMREELRS